MCNVLVTSNFLAINATIIQQSYYVYCINDVECHNLMLRTMYRLQKRADSSVNGFLARSLILNLINQRLQDSVSHDDFRIDLKICILKSSPQNSLILEKYVF